MSNLFRSAIVVAALLASFPALSKEPFPADAGKVVAMTQNLYVGADIFRVFTVPPALIPLEIAAIFQTVQATDFAARAEAIADEVARTRPDLIGLQEVSLIRLQSPGDFLLGNPTPATAVAFDYLEILVLALADRGLDYEIAGIVENTDVELPMLTPTGLDDIRLTDHDVILARAGVETANPIAVNYAVAVVLNLGGIPIVFKRGFVAVDATVAKRTHRFVNTHLEVGAFGPLVQGAQAQELIATLAAETLPVILVGDFNAEPGDPVYLNLVNAGYQDAWMLRQGPFEPGFTCCQAETLDNPGSLHDRRIDFIFVGHDDLGPVQAGTLGDEQSDRTAGDLWPSDHAGIAARLKLQGLKR